MDGMLRKFLSVTVAILFVLAYAGPVMLCGTACAGMDAPMPCCSAQSDNPAGSLSHKCCCDLTDRSNEAMPPSTPATGNGPEVSEAGPAVSSGTVPAVVALASGAVAAPYDLHPKPPLIYKQTCSYLC